MLRWRSTLLRGLGYEPATPMPLPVSANKKATGVNQWLLYRILSSMPILTIVGGRVMLSACTARPISQRRDL
ncbi:hypothetical protein F3J34_30335 [Klebsiella sp. Ap-873]|nr:hypothetical protein [Klebsiella sp. Ap-873]